MMTGLVFTIAVIAYIVGTCVSTEFKYIKKNEESTKNEEELK